MNLPISLTMIRIISAPFVILFLISSSRVHALIAAVIIVAVVALGSKASSTYQCVNDRIVAKSGSC